MEQSIANNMKQFLPTIQLLSVIGILFITQSCGNSVTNIWDYYVTNEVVVHKPNQTSISKRKLLLRTRDKGAKSQLDLVAVKQDSNTYLVIGSHSVGKSFYFNDSLYSFNVTDLFSNVRGNDFIRQMGDLSIYYTHVPAQKAIDFLASFETMRKSYLDAKIIDGATTQIDFYFSHNVFMSLEKKSKGDKPKTCLVWVGRRKHEVNINDLKEAFTELKNFK